VALAQREGAAEAGLGLHVAAAYAVDAGEVGQGAGEGVGVAGRGQRQCAVGALLCMIDGPTHGRPWASDAARAQLRRVASKAGVRRRFAPPTLHEVGPLAAGGSDRLGALTAPPPPNAVLDLLYGEGTRDAGSRRAPSAHTLA
jgi:hypothetical protein